MRGRSENDPTMIRTWSDHKNANRNPPSNRGYFSSSPRAFSIVKYNISRPILHSNLHQILHLPRKVTLDLYQVLHLPRKVTLDLHQVYCTCHEKWHLTFTKYCTCHQKVTLEIHQVLHLPPKVTLELHQILRLPPKVTLELHEVLRLPRKVTRMVHPHHISNHIYNARSNRCHPPTSPNAAPATKNDTAKFQRKCPKTGETSFPMRGRSENDPSMIRPQNPNRNPPRNRGYFSSSPRAFSIVKYNISRPILHSNLHQILHLPRKVTLDLHQVLHLPRKVTLDLHQVLHLPRKVTLDLHQVLHLPPKVTLEIHQVLHLPPKVTLELHQILRLPPKVTLELNEVLRLPRKMTLCSSLLYSNTVLYSTELYSTVL